MTSRRSKHTKPPQARRRTWRVALAVLILAAVVWGGYTLRNVWRNWTFKQVLARSATLLAAADTPERIRAALSVWERETSRRWSPNEESFVDFLINNPRFAERSAQQTLARVTGANYGDRRSDWERWLENKRRAARDDAPLVPRTERVRLQHRWTAPVGLTAWFSTILAVDGQIYVASLGTRFGSTGDTADGVVRVNGADGTAEIHFSPPAPVNNPRDIVGVAFANDGLLVAVYDGMIYALDRTGAIRWQARVGSPAVAAPLVLDTNRDDVMDVVVATRAGDVVALSGRNGHTSWVARVAAPDQRTQSSLGATLALGDLQGDSVCELLVTYPDGAAAVVRAADGRVIWQHDFPVTVDGGICAPRNAGAEQCWLTERTGVVWSLNATNSGFECLPLNVLVATHSEEHVIAGLRTLQLPGVDLPALLSCPTGPYASTGGAVVTLGPGGVLWRCPVPGTIWGTPAIADLNGDARAEIVIGLIQPNPGGPPRGALIIISQRGHILAQEPLSDGVEAAPVVADVDGDGRLDILVADQAGRLHCFATRGYGPVEWGTLHGDSHNTRNATNAYAFGQVPFGMQFRWVPRINP